MKAQKLQKAIGHQFKNPALLEEALTHPSLAHEKGGEELFPETRYFFYLTNLRDLPQAEVVRRANGRCNQENLIEQLKNGPRALTAPLDSLESNWAYAAMAAIGWNLKAWWALLLPDGGRRAEKRQEEKQTVLRMEFKGFVQRFVLIPCQIVRTGRRLIYRVLTYTPNLSLFFRLADVLRC